MRRVSWGRPNARAGIAFGIALAILAACQPPPRPFATAAPGRVSFTPAEDAYGIVLRPVSGLPTALEGSFPAALVEALGRREVPAAESSERAPGALAYGAAEARSLDGERVDVAIEWWVIGRDGRGLGRHWVSAAPSRRDWERASPRLIERLAAESADGIVALLRPASPVPSKAPPAVRVGTVAAPPGLDGETLRLAMIDAMYAARIEALPGDRVGPRLAAIVSLGPVSRGLRRLRVEWRLDDVSGSRIGSLVQENDVFSESLLADWPGIARLIARAATDELGGLLTVANGKAAPRPVDGPRRRP